MREDRIVMISLIFAVFCILLLGVFAARAAPADCTLAKAAAAMFTKEQLANMATPELRAKYQHCFRHHYVGAARKRKR